MPEIEVVSPAYYSRFRCKCGDCRTVCCSGWRITLTEKEYFRMQGLPCSPALRERIDRSVRLTEAPEPDEAAFLLPAPDGSCRMRDADGLCALQKECGEGVLPAVCRMYPRSVKPGWVTEVCCSGSCEGVVEQLMAEPDSAVPVTETVVTRSEPAEPRTPESVLRARREALAVWLSDAAVVPPEARFAALAASGGLPAPDFSPAAFCERARLLAERAALYSVTLADECDAPLALAADPGAYAAADARFRDRYPEADRWLTAILANHLFYVQYPDMGCGAAPTRAFRAVVDAYVLLRLFLVALTDAAPATPARFADVASAVLRYVEHTDFV